MMQSDWENYKAGLGAFRIEKYTGRGWTDVAEFYEEWLREVVTPTRKPATVKAYTSYLARWIKPFFERHPVMLHEIQLDTLHSMLNSMEGLKPISKWHVMNTLRAMMTHAWRSRRIPEVPPFPKRESYSIARRPIRWLPEDRQMRVIEAIPERHRPIFLWLKYHLRRPSEACALRWEDYDDINELLEDWLK